MRVTVDFIKHLNELQESLNLERKALEGAKEWVENDDFDLDKKITDHFEYRFKFHKLCFKHSDLSYQYIQTTYDIEYKENDIGYYSLYTELNGEALDDMLVITDEELKNS